jgi:hypothetical protein
MDQCLVDSAMTESIPSDTAEGSEIQELQETQEVQEVQETQSSQGDTFQRYKLTPANRYAMAPESERITAGVIFADGKKEFPRRLAVLQHLSLVF